MKTYIEDIKRYHAKVSEIEAAEARVIELKSEAEALQRKIVGDMISDSVSLIDIDGIGTVKIEESRHPKVKDQDALYQYLRDSDQGAVIKTITTESVHPSTFKKLNSLYYDAHGCDMPGVEAYEKIQIKIKEQKS